MSKALFHSERIDFVPLSEALTDDYLAMVNDPDVQRMISHETRVYDREGEIAWIRENLAKRARICSMLERKTGRFIGNIEFRDIAQGRAELGVSLAPAMQDRGFGTEGIRRFLEYGFGELGLETVELNVYPHNPRAQHVYEKLGFRATGVREGEHPDIHMALPRAVFYNSSLA